MVGLFKCKYSQCFDFEVAKIMNKFRLLLAGLYPVEFRDFFLGDMYCSQTYAMGVRLADILKVELNPDSSAEC